MVVVVVVVVVVVGGSGGAGGRRWWVAGGGSNSRRHRSDTPSMLGQVAHQSGWQLPYVPFIGLGIDARQVERAKLYQDGTFHPKPAGELLV